MKSPFAATGGQQPARATAKTPSDSTEDFVLATAGSAEILPTSAPPPRPPEPTPKKAAPKRKVGVEPLIIALWASGVAMTLLTFLFARMGGSAAWLGAFAQTGAGLMGAIGCFYAIKRAGRGWAVRSRIGWICISISSLLFAIGCAVYGILAHRGPVPMPSVADIFWGAQQPLLWLGLFALAWRGRSLGLMRLLTDTLIVVLSALVLSWSVLLERKLFADNYSVMGRVAAVYYPISDIAHLFCVLMLIANVRDRPGLARAARWLLLGVLCLIVSDSVSSYLNDNRLLDRSPLFDIMQGWSYILIAIAAQIHAAKPFDGAASHSDAEDAVEAAPPASGSVKGSPWEETLARWHRSAMLWLPYLSTLSVSAILVVSELHQSNPEAVQRLLPVLALLLAIAARQMITLWDNLQLAEILRNTNEALERNVDERTRHLATLHGITSTLNTSLDRRTVLRVTLEKTIDAVGADGGGIWLRDARRDIYTDGAPSDEWTLVHWQGWDDDPSMPSLLRDLSIAEAEAENSGNTGFQLSPARREAIASGAVPSRQRLIMVPVRWQGGLLGVMGLVRRDGAFSYEDRALVESVALEAGTALQNARLYSEAAHRADRDSVTDLFNHRSVQEQLNATLARCRRMGGSFSLVMMDLNNFKFFNDTYGHPVGDDVLRLVARGLRESCRTSDILGRYGGDEFIVVLPDTDVAGTLEACQRIKNALDARHFEPVPGTKLPIATSFGWAAYPQDGETVLDLLTTADTNLYNHKRGGSSYLKQSAKEQKESRAELKKLKNRAFGGSFGVLDALVTAIDNKDHYTRHHSEEVTYFSMLVAREIGYSPSQLQAVRISGLLHDVGKIAVPDHILRHPGKLGREEWDIMQQHPVFGALIVKDVPNLEPVLDGIRHHHEKWDGSGYPDQLVGESIPEMGRLLALGDCYSALTTDRPYRKGWKPEAALEEIERCSGTHFDPRLCAVFLKVMRRELAKGNDNSDYSTRISQDFGDDQPLTMEKPSVVENLAA